MRHWGAAAVLLAAVAFAPPAAAVDVDAFVKSDSFGEIKISPSGEYFAATVPMDDGDRTALVIMRRADKTVTGTFMRGRHTDIADFSWVNDTRVLISVAEKFGMLAEPRLTGELFAVNADGTQPEILVGQRVQGRGLGTKIQPKKVERVAAFLVDDLPGDDDNVIISVAPFHADPFTRAERMNVYSGRRMQIASAPVRNAQFVTDNRGTVRFAVGSGVDNRQQLHYRSDDDAPWQLLNDESVSGLQQWPIGFSADDATAYLEAEQPTGPNAIIAFDVATQTLKQVLRDDDSDPQRILYRNGTSIPVGALLIDGKPRTEFFDVNAPEAQLYRSLEAAFGGSAVLITSSTTDGRTALVETWSDRNPGDFYLFDTVAKKAGHLLSRAAWFAPEAMSGRRPIEIRARDGLVLHGYLTVPTGSDGKQLPMVVMPHGGPFGIQDTWAFDTDAQLLAEAGYAVLQVNFRGSGGYGKAFTAAGARQWGQAMQDDVTDATRWAISEGIAAADRICIYGASYGGYAALMGVTKEPGLYQCAAGYVGVYDLPTMHALGDVQQRGSGETFLDEWIGEPAAIAAFSPNRIADRIKVPVFLAAGGEDERAPIRHSEMMEQALNKAGVPVETLYYPNEGHGFYTAAHRKEYYTRLLAFLGRSLGGGVADTGGGGEPATAE
ncbi:MAG: alpha/beta hydrolase family protein [Lysobacter sp.]